MKKGILTVLAVGSLAMTSGCFVGDDPEGQLRLTWSIIVDGRAGTCAEVNATRLRVSARNDRSNDIFVDTFNCSAMAGTTDPMPTGPYTVTVTLLDAADHMLNFDPVVDQVDVLDGLVADLGLYPFGFTFAKATFRVQMGNGTTSNCGSTQTGGAGVAVQEVRVFAASGNTCLPFTLTTSNENHQSCQTFVCQDRVTVHTIHGLPDGDYDVQVIGYKGATGPNPYPCYFSNEIAMDITGVNIDLGNIVAPFSSAIDSRCDATKPGEG
jgi:hypothetical protein